MSLPFPSISPVAVAIGPLNITWYGISYAVGIFLAWRYIVMLLKKHPSPPLTNEMIETFMAIAICAIILGGRLGYVFFYKPVYYLSHPLEIFFTWEGGMSFHGGLLGIILAVYFFTNQKNISFLQLTDFLACATPIGLFLGRLANFINGELFGRITAAPWGISFPKGGPLPRHPSQLYEAFFEGFLLFIILSYLAKNPLNWEKRGFLSGVFLIGYGIFRIGCEFFRLPDQHMGFFFQSFTWGQILCLPMILSGVFLIQRSYKSY